MLESDVYEYFKSNHIEYELVEHEAAYTIEEIEKMNDLENILVNGGDISKVL